MRNDAESQIQEGCPSGENPQVDGTFYVAGFEASGTSPIVFVSDITAGLRSRADAQ